MNEQQNEKGKNSSNENKRKSDNFFVQELKARAEIRQQTMAFKARVDAQKDRELHRIENDSKRREEDISALESALNGDDAEQIKEALKKMQI